MELTTIKIDVDSRALLKQMAARDRVSMLAKLEEIINEEWARRETAKVWGDGEPEEATK